MRTAQLAAASGAWKPDTSGDTQAPGSEPGWGGGAAERADLRGPGLERKTLRASSDPQTPHSARRPLRVPEALQAPDRMGA